jgi:hypothetical protein
MGILYDNSIIHTAANANLTAFTYTQVYAGAAASVTINGTTVAMVAGSTINIRVKSISATDKVYLIGNPINTMYQNPNLGSVSV